MTGVMVAAPARPAIYAHAATSNLLRRPEPAPAGLSFAVKKRQSDLPFFTSCLPFSEQLILHLIAIFFFFRRARCTVIIHAQISHAGIRRELGVVILASNL